MNILMVLDEEFPPDNRVEKEIEVLMQSGHELTLLCYSRKGMSGLEMVRGIKVIRQPISKIQYKLKALALLVPFYFNYWKNIIDRQLKKEEYHIIHFHDLNLAKVCYELGQKHKIMVVGDYHENRPEIMKLYSHVNRFPGKWLISIKQWHQFQIKYSKLIDHLILVTREAKEYYEKIYGISKNKITVIENFPSLQSMDPSGVKDSGLKEKYKDKKVILYLGDTGWRRGIKTIIGAAEKLRNKPEYHFILIGTSSVQPEIEEIIKQKKLSNIELTGYLPIKEALPYFTFSKIGICPFHRNIHHDTTYANKLFQYMAFGMPVVVSDCPSQVNVVEESDCGLVFKAEDIDDFTHKILQLEDQPIYERLSKNAVASVKSKYNFDVSKKKLIKLYEQLSNEIIRD
jgi:glycosyltransferase involved in cell wall biosynthesis